MEELIARLMENMGDRMSGPMHFRMYMQPFMAAVFAVIAGIKDAKAGRPAYFWALFTDPQHRRDMLIDGWKSVGKVFILAAILDIIYQFVVDRWVYPLEVVITAVMLAIIPYLILRGPINRIASIFIKVDPSMEETSEAPVHSHSDV
jgi:hypothetical protein